MWNTDTGSHHGNSMRHRVRYLREDISASRFNFSLLLSFFGFFSFGFVSSAFENIPRCYIQLHLIIPRNDIESCRWKNNYPDIKLIATNVTEGFSQKIQSGRRKILRRFPSPGETLYCYTTHGRVAESGGGGGAGLGRVLSQA